MLPDNELDKTSAQLADFRLAYKTHQETLDNVLESYTSLVEDYRRLKSDYEEERDAREKYKQLARGQERNPFVLVLVDGDGYIFDDHLVSGGAEGGQRAGQMIGDSVKQSLRLRGLDNCRVMIRIYANLSGLSKALSRVKLAGPEKRSLSPFVANFNRSNDLFDFVDAGELKENADSKIRAMFRQFVDNSQCRHIYFAGCHDVGYLNELTPYTSIAEKITLVRNYAFHHEFGRLGMKMEEFPRVFRSVPLDMQSSTTQIWKAPTAPATSYIAGPASNMFERNMTSDQQDTKVCYFFQKGQCKHGKACKHMHIKATTNSTSDTAAASSRFLHANPSVNSSFGLSTAREPPYTVSSDNDFMRGNTTVPAAAGAIQNNIDFLTSLPKAKAIPPGKIAVNRENQRLDAYLPQPSPEDKDSYFKRITKQKLCNKHHLNGECHDAQCAYDHSPTTKGVKDYLRMVASATPCPRRSGCRNLNCLNGHICQKSDCQRRGGKVYCKFPQPMHILDMNVAGYVDGTQPSHGNTDSSGPSGADRPSPPDSEQVSDDEKDALKDITKSDFAMYFAALRNRTLSTEKVTTPEIDPESDEEKSSYSLAGAKLDLLDEELD